MFQILHKLFNSPFVKYKGNTKMETWAKMCQVWAHIGYVDGSRVGASGEMGSGTKLCECFSKWHVDGKEFLIERLSDNNPIFAVYALKCLMRIRGFHSSWIPEVIYSRGDKVLDGRFGCTIEETTMDEIVKSCLAHPEIA